MLYHFGDQVFSRNGTLCYTSWAALLDTLPIPDHRVFSTTSGSTAQTVRRRRFGAKLPNGLGPSSTVQVRGLGNGDVIGSATLRCYKEHQKLSTEMFAGLLEELDSKTEESDHHISNISAGYDDFAQFISINFQPAL